MEFYFAPLEGLTDSIFRRVHHTYFPGVDRYYMPFLSPTIHRCLTHKEERELPLADSVPFSAVPQILTKSAEDFLWAARVCGERGYEEVNLNLGCPSGTVAAKGKGAGMLADPETLDRFLDAVFAQAPTAVSVKTRLGISSEEEFPALLEVFNRYPIHLLILHPRLRKDFYEPPIREDSFRYALEACRVPLCYNGNLCSLEEIHSFSQKYPAVISVMLGRGLIGDPGMLTPVGSTAAALEAYHDALLEEYLAAFGGSRNAMFRLKEHWRYLLCRFEGSEKLGKRLRKTTDLSEYRAITHEIFHTLPLTPSLKPNWQPRERIDPC